MEKKYRIIVAHPFVQHSFHTASALKEKGLLFKYITCVYDKRGSYTHFISRWLKGNYKVKLQAHSSKELNDNEIIQYCELESLFLLLLGRIDKKNKFVNRVNAHIIERFNKKVVRYAVKNKVDAIVLYDTLARGALEKLKNTGITCVLDMSAPEANYMDKIFAEDSKFWGGATSPLDAVRNTAIYKERLESAAREVALADCFLVASSLTQKSLTVRDVKEDRIILCRYGIQQTGGRDTLSKAQVKPDKLKCLFVGNVNQKKGVHHIFRMIQEKDCSDFRFTFVGDYDKTDCYIKAMQSQCEFTGHIIKSEVQRKLAQADVMIFPTLCDGFGFVVLEALYAGVPVICSANAGACDIIEEDKNGFIIEPSDIEKMYTVLKRLYEDKDMLMRLKTQAVKSASVYTWESYSAQLTVGIQNFLAHKDEKTEQDNSVVWRRS